MDLNKFYDTLLKTARGIVAFAVEEGEADGFTAGDAAQSALDAAHTSLSQRHFFGATDALGGMAKIKARLLEDLR